MAWHFLQRVYLTREYELDCGGMMEVIDRYVELEVQGGEAARASTEARHHLEICDDCAELAAILTELVRLDECGDLPNLDELWDELALVAGARGGNQTP